MGIFDGFLWWVVYCNNMMVFIGWFIVDVIVDIIKRFVIYVELDFDCISFYLLWVGYVIEAKRNDVFDFVVMN